MRREIQASHESLRALAERLGINTKTVRKWRRRTDVLDARLGPKESASTVLSAHEEVICVRFRQASLLPLDDCLYALRGAIPKLTRSSLHRCLKRHGVSRLPSTEDGTPLTRLKTPCGFLCLDTAESFTEEGSIHAFVATDLASRLFYGQIHDKGNRQTAVRFLRKLIDVVPYRIHTILTAERPPFVEVPRAAQGSGKPPPANMFDTVCAQHGIQHHLAGPYPAWRSSSVGSTTSAVARASKRLQDEQLAFYQTRAQARKHMEDFVVDVNFVKRLKILEGRTPYQFLCRLWAACPEQFKRSPVNDFLGNDVDTISKLMKRQLA